MTNASVGYVGYGIESTEGVTVAPTLFLPANAFSIDSTEDFIIPEQLRGTRDHYVGMSAPYSVSGSMDMELVPDGVRNLLKSALCHEGTIVPSAYSGGGYQSVFVPGNATTPTFTFEASYGDILVMRYGGIRVNTLEIAASFGEIVTASWGLEGTTRVKQGSASTESYANVLPFHFTGAGVKRDGVVIANVQNFTLGINNNIDRRGTLVKRRSWARTVLGNRDITFSATMDFQDDDDYDLFLAGTEFAIEIHLQSDTNIPTTTNPYMLKITLPHVKWNSVSSGMSAGDYIDQAVEATVLRGSTGNVMDVVLVNDESTSF